MNMMLKEWLTLSFKERKTSKQGKPCFEVGEKQLNHKRKKFLVVLN